MPSFQILDITDGADGRSSANMFHVFGRDLDGQAHHVQITSVPWFIYLGLPQRVQLTDFEVKQMAESLNDELLQSVRWEKQCKRTNCTCQYSILSSSSAAHSNAWVTIDTTPCLCTRKCDSVAVHSAQIVMGKSLLGYYPHATQFIEFSLARNYYVQPAQRILYKWLVENNWKDIAECEVYNVQPDGILQLMCNSVRLAPSTIGGGRWMEYTQQKMEFKNIKMIECTADAPLTLLAFDLECDFVNGSSVAENNAILSISLCWGESAVALTWVQGEVATPQGYILDRYPNEIDMLRGFQTWITQRIDPDVICGYNSDGFDWPYLFKRAKRVGIELRLGRINEQASFMLEKETFTNQNGTKKRAIYYIPGRVIIDAMPIVEERCKFTQYNLDFVSRALFTPPAKDFDEEEDSHKATTETTPLAESQTTGKMEMSYADISPFFFHGTPDQKQHLFEYNVQDSRLVLRIMKKLNAVTTIMAECKVVGILMKHYLTQGKQMRIMRLLSDVAYTSGYFIPKHRKLWDKEGNCLGMVIPFFSSDVINATEYEGAAVLEPIAGYHVKPIAVGDMMSLYPNIMRRYNVCPTRLLKSREAAYKMGLRDDDVYQGPPAWQGESCLFVKETRAGVGILPQLLGTLLSERARIRKEMKTVSVELLPVYDAWQTAVKVVANSVYGATGAPTGPIFCVQVASTVTAIGRQIIQNVKHHVESEFGLRVVYGDTDSVMFELPGATAGLDGAANEEFDPSTALQQAASYIARINDSGIFQAPLEMACECVYCPFLIQSPKIYSAYKYVAGGKPPELQQKGTVGVKRDNCAFVRETYRNLMHRLMILRQEPDLVLAAMRSKIQALLLGKVPVEKITMTKKLSKPVEAYGSNLPHVQVVKQWQKEQPFSVPRVGERVPFVVTIRVGHGQRGTEHKLNVRPSYCVRPGTGTDTVDWMYYLERLQTPLLAVLNAVFQGAQQQQQLRELFDTGTYKVNTDVEAINPLTGKSQVFHKVIHPRTVTTTTTTKSKQRLMVDFMKSTTRTVPPLPVQATTLQLQKETTKKQRVLEQFGIKRS